MRRSRLAITALAFLTPVVCAALASSCGARTELYVGAPAPEEDAGVDAPPDVVDAPPDVPPDVPEDVPPDVLPPCDPEVLYIYLVTSETELYRYRPDTGVFSLVGSLDCSFGASPFSMGVSRTGIAYVIYNDGNLYKVDTADASCEPTDWVSGPEGFNVFGMGFALDDDLMGETLHVAQIEGDGTPSKGLATIDTTTFELDYIGPFSENPGNAIELTSSDDGNLYGYFLSSSGPGGFVVQIDKNTAEILSSVALPAGNGGALAFAYWNEDFYVFTSEGDQSTTVTRYSPSDGSVGVVATLDRTVVGAGVTTCTIP